ncbi:MAG: acyltransferase [Lysobacteraceae bacterium]|nr:MAG: acyltransferase [Xanthomonadaceae bacterium]
MTSYMSERELISLGFASCGRNVRISTKASIYGAPRISLGNDVRIDDFCILSAGEGGIEIGSYVHIAAFSMLVGKARIQMLDFSGLSSRVSVYSSSDDYSGTALTNPTVPAKYTNVKHAPVSIGRHAIVGAGAVILPGAQLHEGVAVGAMSLVTRDCDEFGVYAGIPARRRGERQRLLLEMEALLAGEKKD